MKSISRKFLILMVVAVALSACNKPEDPSMDVMAMGQWRLSELFVNEQVVANYSNDFILDLETESVVVFVNQDGVGLTGTWDIDGAGTTLTLTSDLPSAEVLTFEVLYLLNGKMGLRRTLTSNLIGDQTFTYVLNK